MSAAAARLQGFADLGIRPRRSVEAAKRRASTLGVSGEVLLWEEGRIDLRDVLASARREWLSGVPSGTLPSEVHELLEATLAPADAERLRRSLARAAQISSTVAATAAVLVAIELAVTLAWQEPLSYLSAERAQAGLGQELDAKTNGAGPSVSPVAAMAQSRRDETRERRVAARERLERKSREYAASLVPGEAVGQIEIPAISASFATVEGAGTDELALGPGHLPASALPGQGRTTAIAGHRTTYGAPFAQIDELRAGDEITLEMPYGKFSYEVERGLVVDPDEFWVTRDIGRERLVLTTCHPEYSAAERLVIFARLKKS